MSGEDEIKEEVINELEEIHQRIAEVEILVDKVGARKDGE